jgi:hypothetical protein
MGGKMKLKFKRGDKLISKFGQLKLYVVSVCELLDCNKRKKIKYYYGLKDEMGYFSEEARWIDRNYKKVSS